MSWRDRPLSCARAQVLLEAFLDGDLRPERRARLEVHLQSCSACRDDLQMAQRVRTALHAMPEKTAPFGLGPDLAQAGDRPVAGGSKVVDLAAWAARFWRPLVGGGAVAAAILIAVLLTRPPRVHQPSEQELARAEMQVRWVVAQIGAISSRAVRERVFEDGVLVPAANAVEAVREETP